MPFVVSDSGLATNLSSTFSSKYCAFLSASTFYNFPAFVCNEFQDCISVNLNDREHDQQNGALSGYESGKDMVFNMIKSYFPDAKQRSSLTLIQDMKAKRTQWVHLLPEQKQQAKEILQLFESKFRPRGSLANSRVLKGKPEKTSERDQSLSD